MGDFMKYSILLLYPEHVWESDPEHYFAYVEGETPESAIETAQQEAASANDGMWPDDFEPVLVLYGHCETFPIKTKKL